MRKLQWILSLCLLSPAFWGQGYGRNIGEDFARRILSLDYVGEGNFRLHMQTSWNGSGPDNGREFLVIYNPEKDSLGPEQVISSWHSAAKIYNSDSFRISKTEFIFSEQECCTGGDAQGLSIRHIDLKRAKAIPEYHMPYQSGAFDPLYVRDTIFILRSLDSLYHLRRRAFSNNYKKVLCHYDLERDSLVDLDTINFGVDFNAPGTLLYDSITEEFELLYDSLQFFFRRGDTAISRSKIHRGSFWHWGRERSYWTNGKMETYIINIERNWMLRYDSCWSVDDTLGYPWVQICQNRFGGQKMTFPIYPPEVPFEGYYIYGRGKRVGNSRLYIASHKDNGSFYLLDYQEDSLVDFLHLKESPHNMRISDLYKNEDGSYFLVGNVPIFYSYSNYVAWNYPIFVKVDPQGNYQINQEREEIFAHFNRYNQLYPFFEEPHLDYRYRIVDFAGKTRKEGSFIGREGIFCYSLPPGAYFFQIWYANNGQYLGQGKFIKP